MLARSLSVLGGLLLLAIPVPGHGSVYQPPSAPVGPNSPPEVRPPGPVPLPFRATPPTPPAPTTPAPAPATGFGFADLTRWDYWWQFNQAPFLALKAHIHSTGSETGIDGWYLGDGQRPQKTSLRPTEDQLRLRVVPALLAVLARETNNHLVSGAMVALAKIGDGGEPAQGARIEAALLARLTDGQQEVRETAAIALGILASPRTIPTLAHLLWDTKEGRKLVEKSEVDYRTRAFSAYGLGLVGARTDSEIDRQLIVSILRRALESERTSTPDLAVACMVSFGLVPLATLAPAAPSAGGKAPVPEASRLAQLAYVLAYLREEENERLVRAHCPIALAKLLRGSAEPELAAHRAEIAGELLERLERGREENEVVQSAILALGAMGTNDGSAELDARIRRVLAGVQRTVSEPQARAFALIAVAEAGGRYGADAGHSGIDHARSFLVEQVLDGRNWLQPWAALAAGVLAWHVQEKEPTHPALDTLRRVLRNGLEDERQHDSIGAYALGAGLARSQDSAEHLMRLLKKGLPDTTRGEVALGLALLGHREAVDPLRHIVQDSKYRPDLLRLGAIALGILGDKEVGAQLATMLADARSLAGQAAIASALGFVGDRRSIEPLLGLLGSRLATERARSFAAVALGNVADKEVLPWNAKIGFGINYRAAPPTLSDPATGTGVLDLF